MYKTFLFAMVCGLGIVACGKSTDTVATTNSAPPSPSSVSTTVPAGATLVAEEDIATQTDTAYSLDWSADGEALAVASGVEVTRLSKDLSERIAVFQPTGGALDASWSPLGSLATVGGLRNSSIEVWDWKSATGTPTRERMVSADSDQYAVSWSPDGTRLATLADDRTSSIQIWDTSSWTLVQQFDLPYANPRRALNWSVDGQTINDAGESNGHVVYFSLNVTDGSVEELGVLPTEDAHAVTFSPDLQQIAVAAENGEVQVIAVEPGNVLADFQSVNTPVDLAWNPKNATLAILAYDTTLQLWSIPM